MADTPFVVIPAEELPPPTSQFVSGLVLGVVLGTAGYYFFGTEEGKHLRGKLKDRWQEMAEAAEFPHGGPKADLADKLRLGLQRVAAELGVTGSLAPTRVALPKTRTTRASTTTLTPQRASAKSTRARAKFRGV